MDKNKCCGNCKHFCRLGGGEYGGCGKANTWLAMHYNNDACSMYQSLWNDWIEITPDNIKEIDKIPYGRVVIGWIDELYEQCSAARGNAPYSLSDLARFGNFYYYVLPELKIE